MPNRAQFRAGGEAVLRGNRSTNERRYSAKKQNTE